MRVRHSQTCKRLVLSKVQSRDSPISVQIYGDIISKSTTSVKKYFLEHHYAKITLDFESHFEYNICHERIYKATMVDTRKSNAQRALLQDVCSRDTGESITQSHGKLDTQTSSVPT